MNLYSKVEIHVHSTAVSLRTPYECEHNKSKMKHYNFRLFVLCNLVNLSWCIELWKNGGLLPLKTVDAACLEPKVIGPCRAKVPRYYYNGVTEECEVFSYGGCGGNSNNFETLEHCNDKCARAVQQEKKSICHGPPQNGPSCEAIIPRWTFNTSTQECVQFIYNGCGETTNNFPDQIDCQLQCGDTSSCLMPKEVGPCFADQKHWWFDASEGECKEFVYGGCGGNSNRYRTRAECENVCKSLVLKRKRQELETEKIFCDGVKCPGGVSHYTELGCKPIYDDGACCPTRFECPERLVDGNSSQCVYREKVYSSGDTVPAADSGLGCRASCICNNGEISCAYVECPELFGYFPKPGCQLSLYRPDQCCAYDYACGNETTVCEFEGEKYVEGQKIYPKEEPCLVCYCKPGFNGTLSTEYCKKIDCGIEIWYSNYLKRGCTPVYFQNSDGHVGCCPISWKCPDEDDAATEESNSGETSMSTSVAPPNATTPDKNTLIVTDPVISVEKSTFSCTEPKAVGDCQATRIRYFYNSNSSQCEEFEYSGCGGNLNNFQSLRQCITACSTNETTESPIFSRFKRPSITVSSAFGSTDPCTEEPRTGRCRAYFRRWFFEPKSNQCKMFIYGGCNRNENNFYTKAACEATCLKVYYDVCGAKPEDLERDCGLDNSTKFYFDAESGLCKRFTSTGCTGTNVFNRYEDCNSQCAGGSQGGPQYAPPIIPVVAQASASTGFNNEDTCLLPRQAGSCIGHFPSYYYDAISKSCKSFIYGGCYGNRNRFMTFEDCKSTCETTSKQVNSMTGGSIAFGDRPQVEDPNVQRWPVSAGKTTALPPTDNNALAQRAEAELTNPSNSIREDDSKFIFTRMIGNPAQFHLNSKPTTDSPDAENTEGDSSSTASPLEGKELGEKSEGLEAEEGQETQFHLTQIPRVSDEEDTTTQSQVEPDSLRKPHVEDPNFTRQTEFNLGQSQQDMSLEVVDDHQLPTEGSIILGVTASKSPRAASDPCSLEVNEGSCNQTILRFHWDGIGCRAFNYTGCGGNKNRFETEYACRRTCSDSFEELASDFYCIFGNRVIPFGEGLDNTSEECGSRFCICSVPPALTCTVKACAS